eukprot:TRINITY_DN28106_c0_g1_i1.p1 TRINITY_DN28106_c0_g1~~TRINITY_DN28106_c0_g1_i1.p1  ORF type:complete len:289 (+),score=52.10 TRINITY_DN28106_c0_g1_i1:91-867(+)
MRQKVPVPQWAHNEGSVENEGRQVKRSTQIPKLELDGLSRSSAGSSEGGQGWRSGEGSLFSLPMLAELLTTTSEFNRRRGVHEKEDVRAVFECVSVPPITVWKFIKNLANVFEGDWIATTILMDRVSREGSMPLTPWNVHRLLLVCYSMSTQDRSRHRPTLAAAGGVPETDLKEMQHTILTILAENISITRWQIHNIQQNFARFIPQHERLHGSWGALLHSPNSTPSPTNSTESRKSMKQKLMNARLLAAEIYETNIA